MATEVSNLKESGLCDGEQLIAIRSDIKAYKYDMDDNTVQAVRDLIADNIMYREKLKTLARTIQVVNQVTKEDQKKV